MAVPRVNALGENPKKPQGRVLGVDLQEVEPIAGADREISHRLAKEVLATGKSVRLSNALAESAWSEQASVVNLDLRSIMCVPLFRGADVVGLLYLDNRTRAGQFSAHDLQLIEIFASQAAAALDNARLARQFAREEKIRVLGNLAGGVAHDFNNLLSVVLGKLQEVLNSQGLPMESERRLRSAEKAALDGAAIVGRLQDFSPLRRASDFAPLRLAELVEDVLEFTRVRRAKDRRQGNRSIEVRVEISEDLFVPGDASELREVFTNLVLNAVSAMPEGGQLSFFATTKDDRVTIQVEDTGVGMTEEVRESLFDPYFTTREKDGLGLGMSIVLGIILRHRGSVRGEGTPGEGSRIFVELPLAAPPEAAAPVAVRNEVSSAAQGGRVLVVDDEESVRELLESALTRAGYDCVPVGDGRMAQAELERAEFDAVVTDLGMVPVSGRDLAAWIRARELGCAVLLVTGWSGEIDAAKAAEWGVDRVLPEPFDPDGVAMAVSEGVARGKQSPGRWAAGLIGQAPGRASRARGGRLLDGVFDDRTEREQGGDEGVRSAHRYKEGLRSQADEGGVVGNLERPPQVRGGQGPTSGRPKAGIEGEGDARAPQ